MRLGNDPAKLRWRDERIGTVGIMLFSLFSHAVQCYPNTLYLTILIQAPHDIEQMLVCQEVGMRGAGGKAEDCMNRNISCSSIFPNAQ